MINLIKNELTKIFKKKAIYITLIITLVFIIAFNVIYKMQETQKGENIQSEIEYFEEQIKQLNTQNSEDLEKFTIYKTALEKNKLIQKYGYNSWQAQIIENNLYEVINKMIKYEYELKNTEEYEKAKLEYNKIVEKLNVDDWRYFAKEELNEIQDKLNNLEQLKKETTNKLEVKEIENQIYNLEIDKQIANWRLEKDIPYGNSYYNDCIFKYKNSKAGIKQYESLNQKEYNQKQMYYDNLKVAALTKYDIENGTEAGKGTNAKGLLLDVFEQFEIFIVIMIIMIAGSIVSDEFSKGTIKLLLIKPYKRSKILVAKWISTLILLFIIIISVILIQFIVGGIVQGFDSFTQPVVIYNYNTNQLQNIGIVSYLGILALSKLPIYVLLMTLAFCLSTIFTSSALSITVGLLRLYGCTTYK